jgi:hypothetical protein
MPVILLKFKKFHSQKLSLLNVETLLKNSFLRLIKNAQMPGARNPEE